MNEFLLVKEVGLHVPVGLVMGSSIYHIGYQYAKSGENMEMTMLTQALYHSRELAMGAHGRERPTRLSADGIVGLLRLTVNLHAWGSGNIIEFLAIGTAVRHEQGQNWRDAER